MIESQERELLIEGMNTLQLPKTARKYYQEIMKQALKDVPINQWELAIQELNQLLLFDGTGNIISVFHLIKASFGGTGDEISVLKNGIYDSELTNLANKEFDRNRIEFLKQSFLELTTGLVTVLGGLGLTGLSLGGTYFSGGTLALVGVTQTGAVAGTAIAGVGVATVVDAVSQMGVQVGNISYSFVNGYGNQIKHTYEGIKNSPNYPEGFKNVQNGTKKVKINNGDALDDLRKVESGAWKKVYKNGYDKFGNKISIHYFESKSGKVFDVKVKKVWSDW